jgi:GMP synthase (glutamine-hydrolysing)
VGFDTVSLTPAGQTETMLSGIAWQHPQFFSCGQGVTKLPPGATLLAGTKATPIQAFKAGVRSYGFVYHFECDRPMLDVLAGAEARNIAAQAEAHYATYARLSDRLAVNIATYCFPVTKKLAV